MKTVVRILALAALMALCLSIPALADAPTVTVNGSAQVSVATDHAIIHLGVRTKSETPTEAQAENKQRTEAVMKALIGECGIAEDKIATSSFSIYTQSEWVEGTGEEKQYYQVTHQLSVTVSDIDKAGAVIDTAVEAGANIIDYVSFESSSMKEAYEKALREAVADAKHKAELIAEASGMKLGDLVSITTTSGGGEFYNNSFRMKEEAADAAGATKLAPGTQNTTAGVTAVWELIPAE